MNDENLIPLTERTKSEQREIARRGGVKSGEARRQKKDIYQLTKAILNAQLDGKKQAAVKQIAGDSVVGEDLTVNALMVAGLVKAALNGNVRAFQCLMEYAQKPETQADSDGFMDALKGQVKETFADSGDIVEE